jgi:hypothetical protein
VQVPRGALGEDATLAVGGALTYKVWVSHYVPSHFTESFCSLCLQRVLLTMPTLAMAHLTHAAPPLGRDAVGDLFKLTLQVFLIR